MASAPVGLARDRLISLDAYRGFTMLLMVSAGLGFAKVAAQFPDSRLWRVLGYQFEHVNWVGCAAWDLIQPSFMFIVGVAAPFSLARRRQQGVSSLDIAVQVMLRSLILVALGVFLYSEGKSRTLFIFPNVLAQIGLAYPLVALAVGRRRIVQVVMVIGILALSWLAFFFQPALPAEQTAGLGLPSPSQPFAGFAAHWNRHANFAGAVDRWLLNLFPRPESEGRFVLNGGGYQTLNFFPAAAGMIVGVMAGEFLRGWRGKLTKTAFLTVWGVLFLGITMAVDHTLWPDRLCQALGAEMAPFEKGSIEAGPVGVPFLSQRWTICPAVKKIWTPTFAVFSTGWTLLFLAGFYGVIDGLGVRSWSLPLVVVGMNSIVIYFIDHAFKGWIVANLKRHLGPPVQRISGADIFSGVYGPIWQSVSVLIVLWLLMFWLYRQRAFLRI